MAETLSYIETLQEAIRKAHGCKSIHVGSVPVHEAFQGKTVWDGTVEIFDLTGHPKAKQCFAWGHAAHDTGNEVRIVTVLGLPPVKSALDAVRVAILSEAKGNR
ncbi:MAG TPA: hypothetical protein VL486_07660 [Verrucomicrobiae bacterium]|nr:hypothetical protein [Verrucomicrobiae bacterium]